MSGVQIRRPSPEMRTKEAEGWIYAGELTAQLGEHAACVVGHHIQRLSGSDDDEAMFAWVAIFNKVAVLLRGPGGSLN